MQHELGEPAGHSVRPVASGICALQDKWRYCEKCFVMFYWGYPTNGVCPVGGGHRAQGWNFTLSHL